MKFALNDKYPIETTDQLIKAAEFFDKNLSRFHPDDRAKIASNLDSQSAKLKVNLNHDWITNYTRIEKSAELSPDFKKSMRLRKEACVRHNIKIDQINGIENAKSPSDIIDGIVKVSSDLSSEEIFHAVTEFDKLAGIEYLYDHQVIDPYLTVFGGLNNAEFDSVKLAGDATQYDLVKASRSHEKLAEIKSKLGEKFASEFNKNPIMSIIKLSSPEKNLLSEITR